MATTTRTAGKKRKCENCGRVFEPYNHQLYCSPNCRAQAFYWQYKNATGERYGARYAEAPRRGRKAGGKKKAAGRTTSKRTSAARKSSARTTGARRTARGRTAR
jgi:hypothetical protein